MDNEDKNVKRQRAGLISYITKVFDGEIKRIMSLDANFG